MNVVNLLDGEEKMFEFSKNNHLFIGKLIFKDGFDRYSYTSVYISNHNLSRRQTVYWSMFNAKTELFLSLVNKKKSSKTTVYSS